MSKETPTQEVFISHKDMEHPQNQEFYTREEKIRAAILRKRPSDAPNVRIIVEKIWLDPVSMGYRANVKII